MCDRSHKSRRSMTRLSWQLLRMLCVNHAEFGVRPVAVIGSGVAGLTAAYLLSARDRVTLFEADNRIGGHAHTHFLDRGDGNVVGVDSAFLVHNHRTYPTLCRLFSELGIVTRDTDMSMSVRADATGLEYAGARGAGGLFPSWSSFARPRNVAMLAEVKRFHVTASRLLAAPDNGELETVDEFLKRHRFSQFFVEYFMTPLVAAVWSCAPGAAMRFPARYLFTFLEHHGMLTVFGSPSWRTVVGGAATYVEAILAHIDEIHAGAAVRSVRRTSDGALVSAGDGVPRLFDAVVIATHPDQALLMLDPPTDVERAVLGAITYTTNRALLHTDESVLPRHRRGGPAGGVLV